MGNLGRAGFGGTTDGTWPYSYDSCDVGALKNQSLNGVPDNPDKFNYQPGQKLSACTCDGGE
jgi:beta-glucanase (GH16 family)